MIITSRLLADMPPMAGLPVKNYLAMPMTAAFCLILQ